MTDRSADYSSIKPESNEIPWRARARCREPEERHASGVVCPLVMTECIIYEKSRTRWNGGMGRKSAGRGHSRWIKPAALPRETGRRKGIPSILKEAPAEEWDTITVRRSTGTTSHSLLFQISTRQFAVVKLYFICAWLRARPLLSLQPSPLFANYSANLVTIVETEIPVKT